MTSPTGTQAVDRAAQLLKEVVHGPDPVTFTELTAATGLAKSTTSRLLMALERNGLVRRDMHGRFRPGEMFVRYAWRGGAEAGLVAVAQPFMDRLGGLTGETINIGVASRGMVHCTAPRWARCCWPTAPSSCHPAVWSSAPSGRSPAGPRWRLTWLRSGTAATR